MDIRSAIGRNGWRKRFSLESLERIVFSFVCNSAFPGQWIWRTSKSAQLSGLLLAERARDSSLLDRLQATSASAWPATARKGWLWTLESFDGLQDQLSETSNCFEASNGILSIRWNGNALGRTRNGRECECVHSNLCVF